MKQQLTKRWERIMSLALAACLGIGLFTPGAMAANGSDMVLIEGDPAPTEDSDYRASTYIQTSNPSAYANLSTDEALALAARNGDSVGKHFNVTMFKYDGEGTNASNVFNNAQHEADIKEQGIGLKEWQALYFTGGDPNKGSSYSWSSPIITDAGYYTADVTYRDLKDNTNHYSVLDDRGEYQFATMDVEERMEPVEVSPKPSVDSNFPNGQEYYIKKDGKYYKVTKVTGSFIRGFDIYGVPTEDLIADDLQEVRASVGVKVADIPVISVDATPVETAEPTAEPSTPVESTEPTAEPSTPVETTEPTAEPSAPVESTEPTAEPSAPVESTEPTAEPSQQPEEVPSASNDASLYGGETFLSETYYDPLWVCHYPKETIYTKKTVYDCTLRANGVQYGEKVTVDNLNTPYTGQTIYEYLSAGSIPPGYVDNKPYAAHNFWTGRLDKNGLAGGNYQDEKYRGYVYQGLMEKYLDQNGDPVFSVPDAGIFTTDEVEGKTVYKNVQFPFNYDADTAEYTFDATQNSAYFEGKPQDGATLKLGEPQQVKYGDGYVGAFLPFNNGTGIIDEPKYHFGMRMDVEFTMTADGKLANDQDIIFDFAGDDDVWVFVDGILVLDLGGIHDSASGSINFNTGNVEFGPTAAGQDKGSFGTSVTTDNIYNQDSVAGQLGVDKDTFVAQGTHELTIFYLERGQGTSNCRIHFNLPQQDSLTVKKEIPETDSANVAIDQDTMDSLNQQEFTFTLYENDTPAVNKLYVKTTADNYSSLDRTDKNGHFKLRNGEQVKFIDVDYNGKTKYRVEETASAGFQNVVWDLKYDGGSVAGSNNDGFTVSGGLESAETVTLTATNTYTHVNGLTMQAQNDVIVVDFGLPVSIDVLKNDIATGGANITKSLEDISVLTGKEYGAVTIKDGKILYTLSKPLDTVVQLQYTATAKSGVDSAEGNAIVTIIPATQMYYEQDFESLVTYSGEWNKNSGTQSTLLQETNKPGVIGNSPYGTDLCYAKNNANSADSVASVDTKSNSASFSYQFTGTGTAILAKLTPNTGYIFIQVKDGNGKMVDWRYRDTRVMTTAAGKDESSISGENLYNIPVYQITGLNYGTYDVEVRIAKNIDNTAFGTEFYLDGIRVYDPLNPADENGEAAEAAYKDDHEQFNKVVSLRDKLLTDAVITGDGISWEDKTFVTLTDTDGKLVSAEDYRNIGPKEELYLDKDMTVSFTLVNWNPNDGKIYLGMKALTGQGEVKISNETIKLNNTIDQYYDISTNYSYDSSTQKYTFTIKVTEGPVSLTNIKVTGDAAFAITENPDVSFD